MEIQAATGSLTLAQFLRLIETQPECPPSLPIALQALWYDKKGDWNQAHEIVQNASDADSAWVHAYLHRQEGDMGNARYWYKRSGKLECKAGIAEEWEQITKNLLA